MFGPHHLIVADDFRGQGQINYNKEAEQVNSPALPVGINFQGFFLQTEITEKLLFVVSKD